MSGSSQPHVKTAARSLMALSLALTLSVASPDAYAGGDASQPRGQPTHAIEDVADFAKQIERDLARREARIAIVFRSGRAREELPGGVRYTHGAFWVYSTIQGADGQTHQGYSVHNLYHGAEDRRRSYLHQDWPVDFVNGDVIGEVGVIIPSPEMQRRLIEMMQDGRYEALHRDDYSLVSNPLDPLYQNCNEFMLDVIAGATWQTHSLPQIKANLEAYFEPSPLKISIFQRMFAPTADERIRLEDHEGPIRTATFASMGEFMTQYGLASEVYEIRAEFMYPPEPVTPPPVLPSDAPATQAPTPTPERSYTSVRPGEG